MTTAGLHMMPSALPVADSFFPDSLAHHGHHAHSRSASVSSASSSHSRPQSAHGALLGGGALAQDPVLVSDSPTALSVADQRVSLFSTRSRLGSTTTCS